MAGLISSNDSENCGKNSDIGWHYLKTIVSFLLAAAAIMKAVNATQILASDGILASRPLLMAVIGLESALAVYLLIAPAYWSWVATLIAFAALSLAAGYALLTHQDCNCFGERLGPSMTLPLDLSVLIAAVMFRPTPRTRFQRAFPISCAAAVGCGAIMMGFANAREAARMTVETGSSSIEFLLADSYVGKPWPVTDDFHPELKALENGSWLVLIVRSDCKHCRELLERYFSDPAVRPDDARTAIFVAGSSSWPFQFDRVTVPVTSGEFVQWDSQEPFVAGPAVFLLSDGIVVAAADGQNSDAFVRKLIKH